MSLHQASQHEERPAQVVLTLRPVAVHCDVQAVPELQRQRGQAGPGQGSLVPGAGPTVCRTWRCRPPSVAKQV